MILNHSRVRKIPNPSREDLSIKLTQFPYNTFPDLIKSLFYRFVFTRYFSRYTLYLSNTAIGYFYLTSKNYRYSFMGDQDYEIGNVYIKPHYRGRGLSKYMISAVCIDLKFKYANFIYIVDSHNHASIKVARFLGFIFMSVVKKPKIFCFLPYSPYEIINN